jgi:hypothetical protein
MGMKERKALALRAMIENMNRELEEEEADVFCV